MLNEQQQLGTLWIISAPSGGGKTSLVNSLLSRVPGLKVSISHITRQPRQGEIEGKNYFFVDEKTFREHVDNDVFLEHAQVFKYQYGTSKKWVYEQLQAGIDVILEIDWQGARRICEQMPCQRIFILPPSREVLLTRLTSRQQDSAEVIEHRMALAKEEIGHYEEYDFVIVNDHFEEALMDLVAIIRGQRCRLALQKTRYQGLINALLND